MRASTLGSAFKRFSRDVHPPQRHAFLCVRAFTTARRMVYIPVAHVRSWDRRIGEEGCVVSTQRERASKQERREECFLEKVNGIGHGTETWRAKVGALRRHNSEITLEMSPL